MKTTSPSHHERHRAAAVRNVLRVGQLCAYDGAGQRYVHDHVGQRCVYDRVGQRYVHDRVWSTLRVRPRGSTRCRECVLSPGRSMNIATRGLRHVKMRMKFDIARLYRDVRGVRVSSFL